MSLYSFINHDIRLMSLYSFINHDILLL